MRGASPRDSFPFPRSKPRNFRAWSLRSHGRRRKGGGASVGELYPTVAIRPAFNSESGASCATGIGRKNLRRVSSSSIPGHSNSSPQLRLAPPVVLRRDRDGMRLGDVRRRAGSALHGVCSSCSASAATILPGNLSLVHLGQPRRELARRRLTFGRANRGPGSVLRNRAFSPHRESHAVRTDTGTRKAVVLPIQPRMVKPERAAGAERGGFSNRRLSIRISFMNVRPPFPMSMGCDAGSGE